jgi:CRP/FNR family transcriptional regulator
MLQTVLREPRVEARPPANPAPELGPLGQAMVVRRLAPRELICQQGDPAEAVFYVLDGALKVYKLTPDGRRQIVGFLSADQFLGLGCGDEWSFSAEALTPLKVGRLPRAKLDRLLDEFPLLGRRLLGFARRELQAAQEHLLLLGRLNPLERVSSFLSRLVEQTGVERLELPMSRQDIADHLGLTIETVSRCFTKLRKAGVIDLPRPGDVIVRDADRLADLASGDDESCGLRAA